MTYPFPSKVVLIGQESTWGTAVTADKDIGLVTDISDNSSKEVIESRGTAIETQQINAGSEDHGSSITGEFQHGRLLEYAIGAVSHTETTGDWKHTFTVSGTPPSMTIESSDNLTTDTVLKGEGMLVESYELTTALNQVVTFKCELKGQDQVSSSSSSAAAVSSLTVFPHSQVTITVNSIPAAEVQDFTVKFPKKVERSWGQSVLAVQGHATELKFEFSGKLGFQSVNIQDIFDASAFTTIFDADNGTALGSGQRQVKITLGNCELDTRNKLASVGSLTFIDISGKGTLTEAFSVDNISSASWS